MALPRKRPRSSLPGPESNAWYQHIPPRRKLVALMDQNRTSNLVNATVSNLTNATSIWLDRLHGETMQSASAQLQRYNVVFDSVLDHSYATTLLLLAVIHLLYARQWNRRRSRASTLTGYRSLVRRKQVYRFWRSLLSHPSVRGVNHLPSRSSSSTILLAVDWGEPRDGNDSDHSGRHRRLGPWSEPVARLGSNLRGSGLPLVVYYSHVLWSCRALEAYYRERHGPWAYLRVLVGLASTSALLELLVLHRLTRVVSLLSSRARLDRWQPSLETVDLDNLVSSIRTALRQHKIGSLTSTVAALLVVFGERFPHVPLQVLPCMGNPWVLLDPTRSLLVMMVILFGLAWSVDAGKLGWLPVVCGLVAGSLWALEWTDFLAEAYWGTAWLSWCLLVSVVTAKASEPWGRYVTCVDFVAWNDRGRVRVLGQEAVEDEDDTSESNEDDDDDHESAASPDGRRRHDDPDSLVRDGEQLYGPVPEWDDDNEDDVELARPVTNMRSRRATSRVDSHTVA